MLGKTTAVHMTRILPVFYNFEGWKDHLKNSAVIKLWLKKEHWFKATNTWFLRKIASTFAQVSLTVTSGFTHSHVHRVHLAATITF